MTGGRNASHTIAADQAPKGFAVNMFEMENFKGPVRRAFKTLEILHYYHEKKA